MPPQARLCAGFLRSGATKIIAPDDVPLRKSIQQHESFVPVIYDDATGKPLKRGDTLKGYASIGYGRNLHEGISQLEADMLLKNDISRSYNEAGKFAWWFDLNSPRQRVIVEMLYNLGKTRFLTFKNALKCLDMGMYDACANELLDSKWADQVGQRAVTLAAIMRTGEMP